MLQRIKKYIDNKGITIAAFERSIGMSNASFGKSLKNNGSIGSDKLEKILIVYPDINPDWLLTGSGTMFKPETEQSSGICPNCAVLNEEISRLKDRLMDCIEENSQLKDRIINMIDQPEQSKRRKSA